MSAIWCLAAPRQGGSLWTGKLFHVKQNYVETHGDIETVEAAQRMASHSDLSRAQDDPWLDLITETGI